MTAVQTLVNKSVEKLEKLMRIERRRSTAASQAMWASAAFGGLSTKRRDAFREEQLRVLKLQEEVTALKVRPAGADRAGLYAPALPAVVVSSRW